MFIGARSSPNSKENNGPEWAPMVPNWAGVEGLRHLLNRGFYTNYMMSRSSASSTVLTRAGDLGRGYKWDHSEGSA